MMIHVEARTDQPMAFGYDFTADHSVIECSSSSAAWALCRTRFASGSDPVDPEPRRSRREADMRLQRTQQLQLVGWFYDTIPAHLVCRFVSYLDHIVEVLHDNMFCSLTNFSWQPLTGCCPRESYLNGSAMTDTSTATVARRVHGSQWGEEDESVEEC